MFHKAYHAGTFELSVHIVRDLIHCFNSFTHLFHSLIEELC